MATVGTCSSCDAPVMWYPTKAGKKMPLDVDIAPPGLGNVLLERTDAGYIAQVVSKGQGAYVSHFASCPQADKHRRR